MNTLNWMKKNWLVIVLVLVVLGLVGKEKSVTMMSAGVRNSESSTIAYPMMDKGIASGSFYGGGSAPTITTQRMVVQDTNMSMLVKDVAVTIKSVERVATEMGGYMVNRSVSKPEGAASGNITLRVPTEKRESALDEIRTLGVKVVSENVFGDDVTDQYVDIDTRIANLQKVKAKMEGIQDQAQQVQDLMQIQMQLNNIQEQIDNLKGQQNFLSQTAKLSKITVSLSTDELALPYAPDDAWRPAVVFKTAVRSMIGSLRSIVDVVIWMFVYLPVLLIIGGVGLLIKFVYTKFQIK